MTTCAGPVRGPEWNWTDVRALCLREARRVLGATSAAADAAQEAASRAWQKRERCQTPARPDPWLAAIASHEALRLLAQRREQPLEDRDRRPPSPTRESRIGSPPWAFGEPSGDWTARTCAYWSAATGKICPTASWQSSAEWPRRRSGSEFIA